MVFSFQKSVHPIATPAWRHVAFMNLVPFMWEYFLHDQGFRPVYFHARLFLEFRKYCSDFHISH